MKDKKGYTGLPDKGLEKWYRENRDIADGERRRIEIKPGLGESTSPTDKPVGKVR